MKLKTITDRKQIYRPTLKSFDEKCFEHNDTITANFSTWISIKIAKTRPPTIKSGDSVSPYARPSTAVVWGQDRVEPVISL